MNGVQLRDMGVKLRDARQEKGFSLRDLSSLADVSPSLLSQIENGKTNPSVVTLYNIATALELPISNFFPQTAPESNNANLADKFSEMTASEARAGMNLSMQPHAVQQYSPLPINNPIVRVAERASIELMGGVIWERLAETGIEGGEFLEIHYQPQATSGAVMSQHSGREFGMVLAGELFLELAFDHYVLHKGDAVIFDSMTPHRLTNKGDTVMRAIWVLFSPLQK